MRRSHVRDAVVAVSLRVRILLQGEPEILGDLLAVPTRERFILTDFFHPRIVIDDGVVGTVCA